MCYVIIDRRLEDLSKFESGDGEEVVNALQDTDT